MKQNNLIVTLLILLPVIGTAQKIELKENNGMLTFNYANKDLLSYQYKTVYPPAGQDTNYKRSGFIHPLYTPHGQVLTRIQPPDHYHHFGIWNPWTHTLFEKDTVDFWNIKGKQGTVRFAKFISQTSGNLFSELEVLHEHVVFKKDGTEKTALNELQAIRVYKPDADNSAYIVDITSTLSCASQSPFLILAYRYAGLGWRATEYWDKNNSEMLTSEGKTRDNTDNTKARWIIVYGALPGNDEGGIVMLSHPTNYNHPEPLRIWNKTQNGGRGDVFANFAPTKDKDWLIEPGKKYTLKYRLVVFNGKMDAAKAEKAWNDFAKQ
jgi:Methane oxygenase PmoA